MFPVYGFVDSSNPHQRHQIGCHKTVPACIPSRPPMANEWWPYGCNYGFSTPMPSVPSYNCGDISRHHGYRPLFPPMMPSSVPYFTPYSMPYCPELYPIHYVPQMPQYDFENDGAWSRNRHCCACPNHQKEDTPMKIQDQEQKLNDWNGWLPLDMDKIKYLMNGEGKKRAQDQKSEMQNMEEHERTEGRGDPTRRSPFPILWMDPHYRREDELGDKEGSEVKTSQKSHLGGGKSFDNSKSSGEKDIAVNWIDPHKGEKKIEAKESNEASSNSLLSKLPKLPPVCLRVDPLPTKNAKGSYPKKSSDTEILPRLSSESLEKVIAEKSMDSSVNPDKEKLSDLEAALRIQSAFRGFEIRRSQPLEKLKQIAEVRKQMLDVRGSIRALESACGFGEVDKKKLVLGETIMRLLLKLDTVQGLHPSLREVRKSLAKELVTLQEKLDSLVIDEKPKAELCAAKSVDDVVFEGEKSGSDLQKQQESLDERSSDADTASNVVEEGDRNGSKLEIQLELEDERSSDADTASCVTEEGERNESKLKIQKESGDEQGFDVDAVSDAIEEGQNRILPVSNSMETSNGDGNALVSEADDVDGELGRDPKTEEPCAEATMEEREDPEDVCDTIEEVEKVLMEEDHEDNFNMSAETRESDVSEFPEEVIVAETEENIRQIEVDDGGEVKLATLLESMEIREEENDIFNKKKWKQDPSEIKKPEELLQEIKTGNEKEDQELCSEEITISSEEVRESTPGNADMSTGKSGTAMEEKEKLRETMETLIEAGQQQLNVIITLSERVKNLEKKLSKRKSKHGRRSVLCKKNSA